MPVSVRQVRCSSLSWANRALWFGWLEVVAAGVLPVDVLASAIWVPASPARDAMPMTPQVR